MASNRGYSRSALEIIAKLKRHAPTGTAITNDRSPTKQLNGHDCGRRGGRRSRRLRQKSRRATSKVLYATLRHNLGLSADPRRNIRLDDKQAFF